MVLSKIAKEAKYKFLQRNPHLHDNYPPVHLDEAVELIEIYVKVFLEEKREQFEKLIKENKELRKLKIKL